MRMKGFVGGTQLSRSVAVMDELSVNVWAAHLPSPTGKGPAVLYGGPGLRQDIDLGTGEAVRALFSQDGRTGAVSGDGFFERLAPGTWLRRGSVARATTPATIGSNGLGGNQWLVVSGGRGYTFNLQTNTFALISDVDFPPNVRMTGPSGRGYIDGYFLILAGRSFYISASADGTSWDAADVASRTQGSDTWQALLIDTPRVYFWGAFTGEVWFDNGAADFPFVPIPEVFMDVGIAAPFSAALVAGVPCWLGQTREGGPQVYRADQFTPVPVSDAINRALAVMPTVEDAIGWGELYEGHPWYVLTFPTANVTYVYDLVEQVWHQRARWVNGQWEAWRGRCHCVAGVTHLVGSRVDGRIYEQSLDVYDDAGDPLRWLRQPPRIWQDNVRVFHRGLELHAEVGVGGLGPDDPLVDLEWSDDGGITWSSVHSASLGRVGESRTRVTWHRLGSARDRIYRFSGSSPTKRAFAEASIELMAGVA